MTVDDARPDPHSMKVGGAYEPPRVERVLTSSELEREFLYAGPPATPS